MNSTPEIDPVDELRRGRRALIQILVWLIFLGSGWLAYGIAREHRFDEFGPPLLAASLAAMILGFCAAAWTALMRRKAILQVLAKRRGTRIATGSIAALLGLGLLVGGIYAFINANMGGGGGGAPKRILAVVPAIGALVAWWGVKLLFRRS